MLYNKPVVDRKDDEGTGVNIPMVQCQHDKNGVCSVHGEGAKEMWKPAPTLTRGKNGSGEEEGTSLLLCVCPG